jgi:ribosomal-protein-alanine N-acetyltransferase
VTGEPLEIRTSRFVLRELRESDVSGRYLSWFADDAARTQITAAATTRTLTDLKQYVRERTGRDDVLFLGIFDAASGLHVGNIKYEPVDTEHGWAVMGILIGEPAYRGAGVAGEVLTASAGWLRTHRGIREITLGVRRSNTSAVRAYEKLGFVVAPTPSIAPKSGDGLTMVWTL